MTFSVRLSARTLLVVTMMIASTAGIFAQLQRQVSYQGFFSQAGGTPIADGQYTIVFRLFDGITGGNMVWEESQSTTVTRGLFNVYLGVVVTLESVDFSKQLYLETALAGQTPFPRTPLAQVPYAIYAGKSGSAAALDSNAMNVVRSVNGAQGNLVIAGKNGVVVTRDGDTISINSAITLSGLQTLKSPQGTIAVVAESGPNTTIDVNDAAVTTAKLADGAVTSQKIQDGAVVTNDISNGAVTAVKIAAGVIPTTLPPSGPAGGDLIGSYPNPQISLNAITSPKILDGAISTSKMLDGSVTTFKLADEAVSTGKVADNAITSAKLAPTGVIAGTYGDELRVPRITVDSKGRVSLITLSPIPFYTVAGGDLDGTYPNPMVRQNSITTSKLIDGAVTTPKIVDFSITSSKIAADAVNSSKIQDYSVTLTDLAPGTIPNTLPPSGPAGGDLTGNYPTPQIAVNSVSSPKILDGAISTNKLLDGAVTTSKLVDNSVTSSKIAADAVNSAKVQDYTITITDLAPGTIPNNLPPSGPAGGDLSGSFPNPTISTSSGAGNRMVDALRADFLGGDADINSANNVVVLDGSGRLPSATVATVGDVKHSYVMANHNGWYLLNGQSIASLPTVARANAAALGFGASLPDTRDMILKHRDEINAGGGGAESIGSTSGANKTTLTSSNIPALSGSTSQDGAHTHTATDAGHDHKTYYPGAFHKLPTSTGYADWWLDGLGGYNVSTWTGYANVSIGSNGTHGHTVGVNSTSPNAPFDIRQKSLNLNMFIYLGY